MNQIKKEFWIKFKKSTPEEQYNLIVNLPHIKNKLDTTETKIDNLKVSELINLFNDCVYYSDMVY